MGANPVRIREERRPQATTAVPLCQRFLDSSARLTYEGLGRAKKTLPHFTVEKTEAHVISQRHTALHIKQEMGWELPLEPVLGSGDPSNPEKDQMFLRVPPPPISTERAGALRLGGSSWNLRSHQSSRS